MSWKVLRVSAAIICCVNAGERRQQTPDQWVRRFEEIRHLYEQLEDAVVYDLSQVLRERELDTQIHGGVTSRVKDTESFRKKIARKTYADPLASTRDLLGVRIVCLYPSVLDEIDRAIRDTFDVVGHEDKAKTVHPEMWRYSSVHYDCKIPDNWSGKRYDNIKHLVFEIQVRTILQDAWATVEHKLGYKKEEEIPDELRREFSALAGLFHVADQRFEFIAQKLRDRAQDIATQLAGHYRVLLEHGRHGDAGTDETVAAKKRIKELESRSDAVLNRGSVKALLRGIYSGSKHARNPDYSLLVRDLESAGIGSLGELGQLLLAGDSVAREEHDGARLADVAFARVAVSAAIPAFQGSRRKRRTR